MCIFLYFSSLIENLPSDRAFHVSSEFDLSVRSGEKKISSDFRLGVLSKWKGERGAVDAGVHSSAGMLPSNETEMCHRGRGDGEDEQKCGQRIQEDEGMHRDCLTSSLFLISSCNGARKYRLCKASQFAYVDPWRQQGWKAWKEIWSSKDCPVKSPLCKRKGTNCACEHKKCMFVTGREGVTAQTDPVILCIE